MQRWVPFCLCWCLRWLHWVCRVCTNLNWAHDLQSDLWSMIFGVFWDLYRFPSCLYTTWQNYQSSTSVFYWCRKSADSFLCSASPLYLSNKTPCQVYADLPGCQGFVPKLSAEAELSLNPLLTLCTVVGGPGKPSAVSEVGDYPEIRMGTGFRLWLLLLPPPNALCSRCGGSWM